MDNIETIKIEDTVYEETYIAHIQKNGSVWMGWIPEVPDVKCEENTEDELLQTLVKELHKALVAEDDAWDKQIEHDVKAGKLDHLSNKAIENYKAGRYYQINDLYRLLEK